MPLTSRTPDLELELAHSIPIRSLDTHFDTIPDNMQKQKKIVAFVAPVLIQEDENARTTQTDCFFYLFYRRCISVLLSPSTSTSTTDADPLPDS